MPFKGNLRRLRLINRLSNAPAWVVQGGLAPDETQVASLAASQPAGEVGGTQMDEEGDEGVGSQKREASPAGRATSKRLPWD